jgi:hypothetical protein
LAHTSLFAPELSNDIRQLFSPVFGFNRVDGTWDLSPTDILSPGGNQYHNQLSVNP